MMDKNAAPLWTATEVQAATQGRLINGSNWLATGLAMDSRAVKAGDIFIALKGQKNSDKFRSSGMDGHDFVADAYKKGAVAVIVDHEIENDIPQIIVPNTLTALENLGRFARARTPLKKAIAITGSVGKTGVRDMVSTVFNASDYSTHASVKSYNNCIGVPFTLANMSSSTEIGVFEVGMNRADEITPLVQQIRPDIAVITWIAEVHIENFSNGIDGIINAKCEIFDGLSPDGAAILPRDNDHYAALLKTARDKGVQHIVTFGEHAEADARLVRYSLTAEGTDITVDILGEEIQYSLKMAGKHLAQNSLIALLCCKLAGCDLKNAAQALGQLHPPEGRGNRESITIEQGRPPITLINEYYNASPVAMRAAFAVLNMIHLTEGGRKIAILGDMRELGDHSQALHESLAQPLIDSGIDALYCCGSYMLSLFDAMPDHLKGRHYDTSDDLAAILPDILRPGDVVLVKGSLGSNMKVIIDRLRLLQQ